MDAWLAPFLAALPRSKQRRWAPLYVRGLLLPGERKSVERLLQSVEHEAGVSGARHAPADNAPGKTHAA